MGEYVLINILRRFSKYSPSFPDCFSKSATTLNWGQQLKFYNDKNLVSTGNGAGCTFALNLLVST